MSGNGVPMAGASVSVVVIDDHAMLAEVLVQALRHEGFGAEAIRPCPPEAVAGSVALRDAAVALVDLDLGEADYDGFDLLAPLLACRLEVVVMTEWQDPLLRAASLDAGAAAVISKSASFESMLTLVHSVVTGQFVPDPRERDELRRLLRERRAAHLAEVEPFQRLTPREQEVLALLSEGVPAAVIASRCCVSLATVRSQIRAVLDKLDVTSQLAAVATARRCGWSPGAETPLARYSSTLSL